ncbi:hypothetical protein THOM_3105 [Trachipleistophora hominis]|uniref:Uncharacterized protein n=1 Tax=Trachipleistophora hominis TaxID=72359 RepID=L7JRP3_TRAHO|nr:hypothetical protein THOM_3105 [Trachipleistophora hominis]
MKKFIVTLVIILCCKASIMHEEENDTRECCKFMTSGLDDDHESCNSTMHTEISSNEHDLAHDSERTHKKTDFSSKVTTNENETLPKSSFIAQNKSKDVEEHTTKRFSLCKACNFLNKSSKKAKIIRVFNIFRRKHKKQSASSANEDVIEKETSDDFKITTKPNPMKFESTGSQDNAMLESEVEVSSKATSDPNAGNSIGHTNKERSHLPQDINNANQSGLEKQHCEVFITRYYRTTLTTNVHSPTRYSFSQATNFDRYITMQDVEKNLFSKIGQIRSIEKQLRNNEVVQSSLFKIHSLMCRRCLFELGVTAVGLFLNQPLVYYERVYLSNSFQELIYWYHQSTYRLTRLYKSLYKAIKRLCYYKKKLLIFEGMLAKIRCHYQIVDIEFDLNTESGQKIDDFISYIRDTCEKVQDKRTIYASKGRFDKIQMLVNECTSILLYHQLFYVSNRPYIEILICNDEF